MNRVVYLTGAPASGKSTVSRKLAEAVPELLVFEYGKELTKHLETRATGLTQEELRTKSSKVAAPAEIAVVDQTMLSFVEKNRSVRPVIIDSHAVTKEHYGYRITPFKLTEFQALGPTDIWVLYTSPEVAVSRIDADAAGRPPISEYEASFHTSLQASVAITYGMYCGVPVHLFDSSHSLESLSDELARRLRR